MNQLPEPLMKPVCGHYPRRPRHGRTTLAGAVTAVAFALLAGAAPAQASAGEALQINGGKLLGDGTDVRVRVSYQCEVGLTAGLGIFLTQTDNQGPDVYGGAGSGQLPCTGETETVTLTIPAGSGRFHPGCADATVSLFTRAPGTADNIEQFTDDVWLERR